ncbi:lipopolysaccharide core heptose(II)-phosphate phosphatase [Escherichia coli]|uniref:lipopolysaccharide core heptose(II)-phosphate phosphatase n=1 Tax=Escherichia coli TaxID=562 RepID=UPI00164F298B|nr:lipopolysaccharide core heptose(II)-phosphate phosphatase [Escherichia coli]EKS0984274.1 lipopolysaccharide core heptose(II)-phosphate phosphatase [Escherichia coli]ELS8097076.1 lipopolysaccharide core heptose(II)-phosphate phosphatase [Escherichia coli]HAN5123652.1 lipopolysaccharide core heptose(II)-phosphate phosphatase [Escherichia coli]HBA3459012.1 lipopolysaccharide core heptose(II)-phosphate phosphatase [Escherichia coli]
MQRRAVAKIFIMFFLATFISISIIHFVRTPNRLDIIDVAEISQKHPIIFLIRHGERCDRSQNTCLSAREGITVKAANQAQQYGNAFNKMHSSYGLYSTDTLRTIQTATFFSDGSTAIIPDISTCNDDAINNILKISQSNNVTVIFTHNHCLSRIAKKMNGWRFKPDYMDTLVLHRENNNLVLDGHLKPGDFLL